jgi:hypothetical protein
MVGRKRDETGWNLSRRFRSVHESGSRNVSRKSCRTSVGARSARPHPAARCSGSLCRPHSCAAIDSSPEDRWSARFHPSHLGVVVAVGALGVLGARAVTGSPSTGTTLDSAASTAPRGSHARNVGRAADEASAGCDGVQKDCRRKSSAGRSEMAFAATATGAAMPAATSVGAAATTGARSSAPAPPA